VPYFLAIHDGPADDRSESAARVVQGIGAAIVMPLSLTILTTAFSKDHCVPNVDV